MSGSVPGIVLLVSPGQTSEYRAIEARLCAAGLGVRSACEASVALDCDPAARPDVLVLAWSSGGDAEDSDAVARLRRGGFPGAILVVGRSSDPSLVVAALEHGADDYVARSCDASELVARVRALARRARGASALGRELDGLVLDLRHSVLRADGAEVTLTRREADLLDYLARHAGRPVTRAELAMQIWHTAATGGTGGTNIVDVYVSYLRRKLAALGRQSLIRSVRGVGYELVNARTY